MHAPSARGFASLGLRHRPLQTAKQEWGGKGGGEGVSGGDAESRHRFARGVSGAVAAVTGAVAAVAACSGKQRRQAVVANSGGGKQRRRRPAAAREHAHTHARTHAHTSDPMIPRLVKQPAAAQHARSEPLGPAPLLDSAVPAVERLGARAAQPTPEQRSQLAAPLAVLEPHAPALGKGREGAPRE